MSSLVSLNAHKQMLFCFQVLYIKHWHFWFCVFSVVMAPLYKFSLTILIECSKSRRNSRIFKRTVAFLRQVSALKIAVIGRFFK